MRITLAFMMEAFYLEHVNGSTNLERLRNLKTFELKQVNHNLGKNDLKRFYRFESSENQLMISLLFCSKQM